MTNNSRHIYVTGDIAHDFFLYRGNRFYSDDNEISKTGTQYEQHNGGAYLIYEMLKRISEIKKNKSGEDHLTVQFGYKESIFGNLPDKNKSYVSLSNYVKDKKKIWRIDEFLGYGKLCDRKVNFNDYLNEFDSGTDVLIIDDAGMDFPASSNMSIWTDLINNTGQAKESNVQPLIICKKSGDLVSTGLFGELLKASAAKKINLMTVLSVNDIRKLDVKISSGLSWEQSASDLVSEFGANNTLNNLLKSTYIVVTFRSSGALVVINKGGGKYEYSLIFDPEKMEGEDQGKGMIIGSMSVFTATLAGNLDLAGTGNNAVIENAVKMALTAVRLFYELGYKDPSEGIIYPFRELAERLNNVKVFNYSSAFVPERSTLLADQDNEWSILINNYSQKKKDKEVELKSLTALAKSIVLNGPVVLKNIPAGRFGDLFTVDRNEIESLRNLKKIMETYLNFDKGKKPLSIAVFGPPGAGKSFAVEQIGKGIMGDMYELICFNLSQFKDPGDIIGALHQVRDLVLKKKIPLVFWDEFDSKNYSWLQYLLAPMQDGAFQEGQVTHPVGKCIFVFAGGTSYTMSAFGCFSDPEAVKDFTLKKGPDFISRINGYMNILGPNRRQVFNPGYRNEEDKWKDDFSDVYYPIRRAMFIINLLRLKENDFPYKMDLGLLNALIRVDRYKHGSRSLANLLNDIVQNNSRSMLLRSWLPSKPILELYFKDADNFISCMSREEDFLEMAWEIAPLIHRFGLGNINDPLNQYSVEYSLLPVFIKESNVMAVRRIPEVLRSGGFRITSINGNDRIEGDDYLSIIKADNNALLEKMSKREHELWMAFYTENGWEHSENRNDYEKKHNSLVGYDQLPEAQKKKDRDFVSNLFSIVEKAGFGIVRE
jgi:hypothetical protein